MTAEQSAEALEACIARIDATDGEVNAFTGKSYARARAEAAAIDARARAARRWVRWPVCPMRSRTCLTSKAR
jgi:Asp-tRNA(Asn)/Glu-tRNA(Gln) amidotransferase A subunit family amidase